jgi:hypothetical protein
LHVVELELIPAQAPEVEVAIAAALVPAAAAGPDPWWQAGIDAALGT